MNFGICYLGEFFVSGGSGTESSLLIESARIDLHLAHRTRWATMRFCSFPLTEPSWNAARSASDRHPSGTSSFDLDNDSPLNCCLINMQSDLIDSPGGLYSHPLCNERTLAPPPVLVKHNLYYSTNRWEIHARACCSSGLPNESKY